MGTKTIGLDDEAYERLKAQKREGESFSDTVKRITDEVATNWRHGFGRYSGEEGERFERAVRESREGLSIGLTKRQERVNEIMCGVDGDDETPR
ncbi:MAG: antitoxin VapB family protein [Euryarchaeota archaeon]|jgi:predicted CopG family antitoxin|nr:antitoxin VapB family protein [Euryarchaeota archaeon]